MHSWKSEPRLSRMNRRTAETAACRSWGSEARYCSTVAALDFMREGTIPRVLAGFAPPRPDGGSTMESAPRAESIAPFLSVRQGSRAVDFYKAALGARELFRIESPTGDVVARLAVGEAEFWVSDESAAHGNFSPQTLGGATTRMVLTVPDPDAAYARAVAAGARSVTPVSDMHGWRVGRVEDPFGHHWEIGRPLK